ncbi:MAG: hypothetical protein EXR51_03325 [Dehalococcoidia bacterium]|nr:hypothetical protein [Dehalococcoidia bacterium]
MLSKPASECSAPEVHHVPVANLPNGTARGVTRRGWLATAGAVFATACSPAVAPAPATAPSAGNAAAPPAWQAEWDELVKAARQEGKLVLVTSVGESLRNAALAFEQAFPGIVVEHTGLNASNFVPRMLQERKGGVYSYDILLQTTTSVWRLLRPEGALDPVKPLIVRPDATDDTGWRDGFKDGFLDKAKEECYAFVVEKSQLLWVNTDMVSPNEITKPGDLLNPKWKGKVVAPDVRAGGSGYTTTALRLALGDEGFKQFFTQQEPRVSRDLRQMTEWMARGIGAIGVGAVQPPLLREFLDQGVGKNLKYLEVDRLDYTSSGSQGSTIFKVNRSPHPNAAKLFINWLLTREGQTLWTKLTEQNSRRTDVDPFNANGLPSRGKTYVNIDTEEMLDEVNRTAEVAKAMG